MFLDNLKQYLKDPSHPMKGGLDHLGRGVIHIKSVDDVLDFILKYNSNRDGIFNFSTSSLGGGSVRVGDGPLSPTIRTIIETELNSSTELLIKSNNAFDPSVRVSLTYKYIGEERFHRLECRTLYYDAYKDNLKDTFFTDIELSKVSGQLATYMKHRAHAISKITKQYIRSTYVKQYIFENDVLKELHRTHQNRYDEIMLPNGHHGDPYSTLLFCNRQIAKLYPQAISKQSNSQIDEIDFPRLVKVRRTTM